MEENGERKFLHDIASPIGSAMFILDVVIEGMEERPDVNQEDLAQIKKTLELLNKIKTSIEQRREILIRLGVPSSKVS